MGQITAGAVTPERERVQARDTGRTIVKACVVVSMLLSGSLMALRADAADMLITTTGTITSGSETGGLFGLPAATTSLVGDSYTLLAYFYSLGSNYTTDGSGSFASDLETPGIGGYVTAVVNGVPLTVNVTNSYSSSLFEDLFDLDTANQGTDASGNYANISQSLSCASTCVPYADLLTPFLYSLGPNDFGSDIYSYDGSSFPAASAPTATFTGTETSMIFQVPEPGSWALLATALLGIGILARRRGA